MNSDANGCGDRVGSIANVPIPTINVWVSIFPR